MRTVVEVMSKELVHEILEALPKNDQTSAKAHPQHDGSIRIAVRINGFHHLFDIRTGMKFNKWGQAQEASETSGIIKHSMRKQHTDASMMFDLLRPDSIDEIKAWVLDFVRRFS